MAVNVFIAAKFVMNCMIGICVKENVSVAVKLRLNSTIGTVASVTVAVKPAMNCMIGMAVSVLVAGNHAMSGTIGTAVYVLVAIKHEMNSTIGICVKENVSGAEKLSPNNTVMSTASVPVAAKKTTHGKGKLAKYAE